MCAPIPHDPSTNEISALSKTQFSGSGKVHTGKSAVLWALPNSMLPLDGVTLFAYCHSPGLSSHPSPVPGSGGQPKIFVLWVFQGSIVAIWDSWVRLSDYGVPPAPIQTQAFSLRGEGKKWEN